MIKRVRCKKVSALILNYFILSYTVRRDRVQGQPSEVIVN